MLEVMKMKMFQSMQIGFIAAILVCGCSRISLAFVVPENARAKVGGGKNRISSSAPPESLSFASVFQKSPTRQAPRISEANFRLDYIQGVRPSYNNNHAPPANPTKHEVEETKEPFVYGKDSTCYCGLTKPSKAGLVLAFIIASGMIAVSPTTHLSITDPTAFAEAMWHFGYEELSSTYHSLFDQVSFRWDMMGLPEAFHEFSDHAVASIKTQTFPFVYEQTHQAQNSMAILSNQLADILNQVATQADMMTDSVWERMTSTGSELGHFLTSTKVSLAQHSSHVQDTTRFRIQNWFDDFVQSSGRMHQEMRKGWNQGREACESQINHFEVLMIQGEEQLHAEINGALFRGHDFLPPKLLEIQEAGRLALGQIEKEALHLSKGIQAQVDHLVSDAEEISRHAYTDFRAISSTKIASIQRVMFEEIPRLREKITAYVVSHTDRFEVVLGDVKSDLILRQRDFATEINPLNENRRALLNKKSPALDDMTLMQMEYVQDQIACRMHTFVGDILDQFRSMKDATEIIISRSENSFGGQFGTMSSQDNTMNADSEFLKSILKEMTD